MPFIIDGRRGGRIVAAVITALALSATPALASTTTAPTVSTAPGCTTPTTQAFLFTNDKSDYVLAPGGNFEGSLAGWSLTGGAATVTGSAPAVSGGRLGAKSLLIPNGGSVTSAPMCVVAHSPYFRFQARSTAGSGTLKVEVLYLDGPKYTGEREVGYVTAGSTWAPTKRQSLAQGIMGVNGSSTSQATIAFRFTAVGGGVQVDDLYVDPFRRF
jgi:ribosomal protein L31